jgi:hypothetical protein
LTGRSFTSFKLLLLFLARAFAMVAARASVLKTFKLLKLKGLVGLLGRSGMELICEDIFEIVSLQIPLQ